jgi:hypothetical protein
MAALLFGVSTPPLQPFGVGLGGAVAARCVIAAAAASWPWAACRCWPAWCCTRLNRMGTRTPMRRRSTNTRTRMKTAIAAVLTMLTHTETR